MRVRTSIVWISLALCGPEAFAQCVEGPDAEAARALEMAFEAQAAVRDHLAVAAADEESRVLLDAVRDKDTRRGQVMAQASLNFSGGGLRGFQVCDAVDWQPAELESDAFGLTLGAGARGIVRGEVRFYGVSDSVVQNQLADYYPEREAGAVNPVPGAVGAGHGLISGRVVVLDEVSLTMGLVRTHKIDHTVGWEEETDDEGGTYLSRSHTSHWRGTGEARTFVALGAPRFGSTDLVWSDDGLERVHAGTGWIVPRPRRAVLAFRVDGGWDETLSGAIGGAELMPLGGVFAHDRMPALQLRAAGELSAAAMSEASLAARWAVPFTRVGLEVPGDIAAVRLESGAYGGSRLPAYGKPALVPGATATADVAVPFVAMFRLGGWLGVNRLSTINAVPDAVGRAEWGLSFYASYAL